jgi:CHASE2 domain-containing sensor protein
MRRRVDGLSHTSAPMTGIQRVAVLLVAVFAASVAMAASVTGLWTRLEHDTVAVRFQLRHTKAPTNIVVVAIDDVTFDAIPKWPFPRSLHGKTIDSLRRAGAKEIVYDVQFTEPTTPKEDNALYAAVARARNVVLATTETNMQGGTKVLGGDANLRLAHAEAAASNLPTDDGGTIHRFTHDWGGLDSMGVVAARRLTGTAPPRSVFETGGAWIDYRGPPGTFKTLHFSDVAEGKFDAAAVRGKIVVVGASSQTLQDVHATPTAGHDLMSGPEVQANTIWTALHGLPLRSAPRWLDMLVILLLAGLPTLSSLVMRPLAAALTAPVAGAAFAVGAQVAFNKGIVVSVTYPITALGLGTFGMIVTSYLSERRERFVVSGYNELLESRVRERTEELRETQLEVIHRLATAAESRDADTGEHIHRLSRLCECLGVAAGMSEHDAEQLGHASALHDVGKIGIPDRVLLKPGRLDGPERNIMRSHTRIGAEILAGSPSELIRLAEVIALTHHERWDGSGYPAGLRGEEIPLVGRICAICDVFDALLSKRPYKDAWSLESAVSEIAGQRGKHFDPELLDTFLALVPTLGADLLGDPTAQPGGPLVVSQAPPADADAEARDTEAQTV